jgi:hypothetical protein
MKIQKAAVLILLAGGIIGSASVQAGASNPGNPLGNNTTNNLGNYSGLIRIKTATYNILDQSIAGNTNVTVPPVMGTMKFSADTNMNSDSGVGKITITSAGKLVGDIDNAVVNIDGTGPGTISATYVATNTQSARITNSSSLPGAYLIEIAGGFSAALTQSGKRGPQTFVTTANDAANNQAVGALYAPTSGDAFGYVVDMSTNASVSGRRISN